MQNATTKEQAHTAGPMVSLPTEMSEQMVSIWQSAFHLQLHARYKSRFKPDKNPESAESAAWKAVVRHCAIEAAEGDLLGEALEAIHTAGMALASERKSLMNEFALEKINAVLAKAGRAS